MADTTSRTAAPAAKTTEAAPAFDLGKVTARVETELPSQARERQANPADPFVEEAVLDEKPRSLPVPTEEAGEEVQGLLRKSAAAHKYGSKVRVRQGADKQWRVHYVVTRKPTRGKNK